MQPMTKRDRVLLAGTLCALVLFLLGWYVIRPTLRENRALRSEIIAAEAQKAELEAQILELPALRGRYDALLERYDGAAAQLSAATETEEIGRMLTARALELGLFCDSLHMEAASAPLYLKPYAHSAAASEGDAALPGIGCVSVRLSVRGSEAQCRELLDGVIRLSPALRVTVYAWERDGEEADFAALTVDMELYIPEAGG